ncbi:RNA polymerase sigma factor [Demequina zhanjiangensis]|uniref:Sigma-70 family RNA polymerase sigma factor n=1 Tax=Demequina zhanjiangensis TaxID=3051659 RepID=A0ABT8FYC5_9MICO|nr:sigma-70 family RNA polymerase sigma factor [Demequina sp. SYSU T00b26]MDN4471896.1 sigma-70 family RNA polymerase sigma factor [Demequina sp. SYSU T00b26]
MDPDGLLAYLCEHRYGRLIALATMMRGTRDGADDVVQDALVAVFSKPRRFPSEAAAEAYVRKAITTRALDEHRRTGRERNATLRLATLIPQAHHDPEPAWSREIDRALADLTPRVRACVILRYLDDQSIQQTADLLGLSPGAVKRYTSDGIRALNAALGTTADPDDHPSPAPIVTKGSL